MQLPIDMLWLSTQLTAKCFIYDGLRLSLQSMLRLIWRRMPAAYGAFALTSQRSRHYGNKGSLHLTMEPLEKEYEGIFQINLTRPEARNAIGIVSCVDQGLHAD